MNFAEFCKKIRVIIRAKSSVWAAIRETLAAAIRAYS